MLQDAMFVDISQPPGGRENSETGGDSKRGKMVAPF